MLPSPSQTLQPPPSGRARRTFVGPLLLVLLALGPPLRAVVDDALSFAYEAAAPYVAEGFLVREEAWAGDLGEGESKGIAQQLFKGNEYWFWAATDEDQAAVAVNIYDREGNLAEVESWVNGRFAAARIIPKSTGTYYILVRMTEAPANGAHWGMVYGFR